MFARMVKASLGMLASVSFFLMPAVIPCLFLALFAILPLLGVGTFPVGAIVVLMLTVLGFSIYTEESGIIPF